MALVGIHGVEITVCVYPAHVVHRGSDCGLDAGVDRGSVERHTSPSANTDDTDAFGIDIIAGREVIHSCAKVLGVNIGRGYIAGCSTTLSGVGGIEGDGQETEFGHCLCVEACRLFFHSSEWAGYRDSRHFPIYILWSVHIGGKRDAIAVAKRYLTVIHFIALRENLIPFFCQF